jgi:hypothetical protein
MLSLNGNVREPICAIGPFAIIGFTLGPTLKRRLPLGHDIAAIGAAAQA